MKNQLLILLCIFVLQITSAQKKIYITKTIKGNDFPKIDGVLDDEIWNTISWGADFIENNPDENTPPTYQTKFKILYDAKFLYVAIRCFDEHPEKIENRLSRRDGFAGDRVNVVIDSYHDKRTAFVFTVTAAGVKGDEFATKNGGNWDASWNPIWYTNAVIDAKGWTAEMKIPFSQLRFGKAKEQIWGLNVIRQIFRKNERSLWNRVPADAGGFISESGELRGLIDLKPQKQLEIQPFTTLQYDTYPKQTGNPFKNGNDVRINGGIDAKIGITNDLTLDLTINPDFGQVEADPGSFSLDGFQIFLPEKRPFFVENKNIFDYKFADGRDNVFYSRRIGGNPHGNVSLLAGEYVNIPQNTTILGAAKFSGKTKSGWSIGLLESVTSKEFAEIDNNGTRTEKLVEPLTNYLVLRTQKDFNNKNSYIGGIFTATNRNLENSFSKLHTAAYSGGLDFRHSWKNRIFYLQGNVIISKVLGSKTSIEKTQKLQRHLFQRVGADYLEVDPNRTSLTGTGGKIEFGKSGGNNWRYRAGVVWQSPELELNDIGFLRNTDKIKQYALLRYQSLKPSKNYRNASVELEYNNDFDFGGNYNNSDIKLKGKITWKNNWWSEMSIGTKTRLFSNSFLRGGPRWRTSPRKYLFVSSGTDRQKKFNTTFRYIRAFIKDNSYGFKMYRLGINYQPSNSLNLSLNTSLRKSPNKAQFVTQRVFGADTKYILGEIDYITLNTSLRINYSLNPNLSVQFYGSPFITKGTYTNFNFVTNATAKNLNDRVRWYNTNQISVINNSYSIDEDVDGNEDYSFRNPDFTFVQFQSNLVVRWEYIPGSEIFLVWSRGIAGSANAHQSLLKSIKNQIFSRCICDKIKVCIGSFGNKWRTVKLYR